MQTLEKENTAEQLTPSEKKDALIASVNKKVTWSENTMSFEGTIKNVVEVTYDIVDQLKIIVDYRGEDLTFTAELPETIVYRDENGDLEVDFINNSTIEHFTVHEKNKS